MSSVHLLSFNPSDKHGRLLNIINLELEKRNKIIALVDFALLKFVQKKRLRRCCVRRGTVHVLVAKELGVNLDYNLRTLINHRAKAYKMTPSILYGQAIFRFAALRPATRKIALKKYPTCTRFLVVDEINQKNVLKYRR